MDAKSQLLSIKGQLDEQIYDMVKQACEQENLVNISKHRQELLKQDLGMSNKKNYDFMAEFPQIYLTFLERIKRNYLELIPNFNSQQPKRVKDLFQISYFVYKNPIIQRHEILQKIVMNVNKQIQYFFSKHIDTLKDIYHQTTENPQNNHNGIKSKNNKQQQKQQQLKNIENIVEDFKRCFCKQSSVVNTSLKKSDSIKCQMCSMDYHNICLRTQAKQPYICPYCTIYNLDPLSPIESELIPAKVYEFSQQNSKKSLQFEVNSKFKGLTLEIRCLRFDEKEGLDEITWPDKGHLLFNKDYVMQFTPMTINTSLKKRKDEKYSTNIKIKYNECNEFLIMEEKSTPSERMDYRINQQQQRIYSYYITINQFTLLNWSLYDKYFKHHLID